MGWEESGYLGAFEGAVGPSPPEPGEWKACSQPAASMEVKGKTR